MLETTTLINLVLGALAAKKARNVIVLDLRAMTVFTDYFIIATAGSAQNSRAIIDGILDETRKAQIKGIVPQGLGDAAWILLDLGDVIVHIFDEEHRDFYQLERLWHDAPQIPIPAEYLT